MLIIYLYTANIQKIIKNANKISCKNETNLFRYKKTSELHDIIMPSYFVAGGLIDNIYSIVTPSKLIEDERKFCNLLKSASEQKNVARS